jgi:hypothetical protein
MDVKPTVRVVFRAERSGPHRGTVTAVFDDVDMNGAPDARAGCYTRVGQHGDCSRAWYHSTRAAKPEEYAPLLAELRQIYSDCRLVVAARVVHR